ncbi:hypothetical protein [Pseudorhodobacter ferrugineus]|uniref:hypothetical protein n=1 Tax=Pseudorhodobacter ferrugineus TaxID=77008 RepID=UPI0003B416E8|nr:hypothetical protein [Pseudorhodobacter ferrugineus]
MSINPLKRLLNLPILAHITLAIGSFVWFQWAKGKLDASYAASMHPVDYMTGQTSFSGEKIKGFYATMVQAGTLDVYVTTQLIDFGFILGFVGIGLFVCTLIARLSQGSSIGQKLGLFAAASFLLGALCDAIENLWSFVMLANPATFADWLALPYSAFAVLKFGFITLGMALVIASLVCALLGRVLKRPNLG